MNVRKQGCVWMLAIMASMSLQGCEKASHESAASQTLKTPITIEHELGTTVLDHRPQRVAVLDMNEADLVYRLQAWSKTTCRIFWLNTNKMLI